MALEAMPTIIRLMVEPKTLPILIKRLVRISDPGMKEVKVETMVEYKKMKKTTRVVSKVLNL